MKRAATALVIATVMLGIQGLVFAQLSDALRARARYLTPRELRRLPPSERNQAMRYRDLFRSFSNTRGRRGETVRLFGQPRSMLEFRRATLRSLTGFARKSAWLVMRDLRRVRDASAARETRVGFTRGGRLLSPDGRAWALHPALSPSAAFDRRPLVREIFDSRHGFDRAFRALTALATKWRRKFSWPLLQQAGP